MKGKKDKHGNIRCEHNCVRAQCKDCKGASICEHHRERFACRDCGICICKHNKRFNHCSICKPDKVFDKYFRSATRRGLDFSLTPEQFTALIVQPCFLCGQNRQPRGVDRSNNKIGYVLSNCQPCCGPCNMLKGSLDELEFINLVCRIAEHIK